MFTIDVPYVLVQETPIVLAQDASPTNTPVPDYLLKACQETTSIGDSRSAFRSIDPAAMLEGYLGFRDHRPFSFENVASIKPTLLEDAMHGKIISEKAKGNERTAFRYNPVPNYVGNDKAVFMAKFEGKVYKIVINLVVNLNVGESPLLEGEEPVCPPPQLIKANGKPVSGSLDFGFSYKLISLSDSNQPNPSFERDAAKARRPSTLR